MIISKGTSTRFGNCNGCHNNTAIDYEVYQLTFDCLTVRACKSCLIKMKKQILQFLEETGPVKLVRVSTSAPHSVDLFDKTRNNQQGEMWCVAPGILRSNVDEYWEKYLEERRNQNDL